MFMKLNNSKKNNFLRSRPPAGQHQQQGKSSFSKISTVNDTKGNVKANDNKDNVKVKANTVNVQDNDSNFHHRHYKLNHKTTAVAGGSGTSS